MEYATRNVLKPPKWSRIIWSDEKKFNLDGPDGFQYYWHDLRREKHTYFTRNSGGASVMVWGGFSGRGCTQLAFLEGRQNADAYQYTLSNYLFPFGHQHYGPSFTFMQDGASIYTAVSTKAFLAEQSVTLFNHPALYPTSIPSKTFGGGWRT
ncbi:hypothetical protein AaE_013730, partial [Aphanomyces astaci]